MLEFKSLPTSDTVDPPPPPDATKTYFYGYKFFEGFDPKCPEHLERVGRILVAAGRLMMHAHVIYNPSGVLVFLALFDPTVNIITPRPGSSKIPCHRLLQDFQKDVGIDFGPSWHLEDGLIFPLGSNAKSYLKSIQPMEGLWAFSC